MNFALVLLLLAVSLITVVIFSKKFNKKLFFTLLSVLIIIFTIGICTTKPKIHNQFSMIIVDYIFKFDNTKGN